MPPPQQPKRGLLPSIIDRLVDPESAGTTILTGYTVEKMYRAVLRDLEDLLNSVHTARDIPAEFPDVRDSIVGYGLPVLELAIGALLLLGLFTRVSAVVAGLLMVAFIIGIASAWARGLSIDCGCFGNGGTIAASQTQYPQEIARDIGLFACAAWLAVRPRSALSLDRLLSPAAPARPPSTTSTTSTRSTR